MKIEVHDVDHGQCVVITTPNNKRVVLDCGVNHGRGWYPSEVFRGQRIDLQILQNLDEDHVEDLPGVWANTQLGCLVSNPTVDAATLKSIKWKGMKPGVQQAHDIFRSQGTDVLGTRPDLGAVSVRGFWNRYGAPHKDTNNLSLAIFVEYAGFSMLFGGDLETAGWQSLLRVPGFAEALARVKVMVASHHGRHNGRCAEVFDHCKPELVIFSDGAKQYGTQETDAWYRTRASGVPEIEKPKGLLGHPRRYVMTTRHDGCITLTVGADGRFHVYGEPPATAPSIAEILATLPRLPSPYLPMTGGLNLSALAQGLGAEPAPRSPLADVAWPVLPEPYRPMTSGLAAASLFNLPPLVPGLSPSGLAAANAMDPAPSVLDPRGLMLANALLGTRKKSGLGS